MEAEDLEVIGRCVDQDGQLNEHSKGSEDTSCPREVQSGQATRPTDRSTGFCKHQRMNRGVERLGLGPGALGLLGAQCGMHQYDGNTRPGHRRLPRMGGLSLPTRLAECTLLFALMMKRWKVIYGSIPRWINDPTNTKPEE